MNVLMGLLLCYELNIFLLMTKQSSLSLSDTSDTTLTVHACFVVGILVDITICLSTSLVCLVVCLCPNPSLFHPRAAPK